MGIRMKREGALCIFNYEITADFTLPQVQEARGIILNTEKREVVCWPFRKFGNHNESYADEIDWSTARVQEKVDGSIVKLWYDEANEKWQFSTNGCIRAERASVNGRLDLTYGELIEKAENYGQIPFDRLDAPTRLLAKVRYRQEASPARVEQIGENELLVEFEAPQRAICKGQSLVLYHDDYLIGGGIIS